MSQDPDPNRAAVRKTAIIDNELYKHKFDIAALQETQLAGSGTICKTQEEPRLNGSGFAVALLINCETPFAVSDRISAFKLSTNQGNTFITNAYAPTLTSTSDSKDNFYHQLEDTI